MFETLAAVFTVIGNVATASSFVGLAVFVVLYTQFYQWRKRKAGKSVFFLSTAFLAIGLLSVLVVGLGDAYALRSGIRALGWLYGLFAVCYLLYALIYNWRDRHPIEVQPKTGESDTIPAEEENLGKP